MAENIGQTESNRGNKQNFERERDTRKGGEAGTRDMNRPASKEASERGKYDYPGKEVGQKDVKGPERKTDLPGKEAEGRKPDENLGGGISGPDEDVDVDND